MNPEYEYLTFEDWFDELEKFCFRSERFYACLPEGVEVNKETREYLERWLRAAFECGRMKENDPS